MSKIIVTCVITGSIHTPSMSPYLPVTADQITSQAVDAAEAGAAILHLHARDPDTGKPSASPEHFAAFLPRIKQASAAVLNISTGGSAVMSLEERLAPAMATEPEMCSLNMGTMNFALYQAAARVTDWKHDWEKPFLEDTDDLVFKNTPRDIAQSCARSVRPEVRGSSSNATMSVTFTCCATLQIEVLSNHHSSFSSYSEFLAASVPTPKTLCI